MRSLLPRLVVLVASWAAMVLLTGFNERLSAIEIFFVALATVGVLVLLDVLEGRRHRRGNERTSAARWRLRIIVYASAFTLVFIGHDVLGFLTFNDAQRLWPQVFVAAGMLVAFLLAAVALGDRSETTAGSQPESRDGA